MRLDLGTPVRCIDDKFGELDDVVIDPITRRITHLVVRSHGKVAPARLVPIGLVETDEGKEICLRCSVEEAGRLDAVQDFAYLRLDQFPVDDPKWDVGIEHTLAMPYYPGSDLGNYADAYEESVGVSYDRVPKGEVEIQRSSAVVAADGDVVGHVDGFLVDRDDHISHFVLERGHLWKRREVTVPISAVEKVETDSVTLNLTKRELGKLPPMKVRRWEG
jgi:sporulation protein YlmC with PRC-barrel domain